jgi:hypothetical protein
VCVDLQTSEGLSLPIARRTDQCSTSGAPPSPEQSAQDAALRWDGRHRRGPRQGDLYLICDLTNAYRGDTNLTGANRALMPADLMAERGEADCSEATGTVT